MVVAFRAEQLIMERFAAAAKRSNQALSPWCWLCVKHEQESRLFSAQPSCHPPISRHKVGKVWELAIGHRKPRSRQRDSDCLISDGYAQTDFTSAFGPPYRHNQTSPLS
jgi:hypothetical protein